MIFWGKKVVKNAKCVHSFGHFLWEVFINFHMMTVFAPEVGSELMGKYVAGCFCLSCAAWTSGCFRLRMFVRNKSNTGQSFRNKFAKHLGLGTDLLRTTSMDGKGCQSPIRMAPFGDGGNG